MYEDFNEIVKSESHPFPVALHARTYLEQVFNTWYNYKEIYDASCLSAGAGPLSSLPYFS
jgi:hypothetical protein